jgi:hypothetical protein
MVVWGMREAFQEGLSACISGGLTSECRIAQQAFHLCRDERRRKLGPNQPPSFVGGTCLVGGALGSNVLGLNPAFTEGSRSHVTCA